MDKDFFLKNFSVFGLKIMSLLQNCDDLDQRIWVTTLTTIFTYDYLWNNLGLYRWKCRNVKKEKFTLKTIFYYNNLECCISWRIQRMHTVGTELWKNGAGLHPGADTSASLSGVLSDACCHATQPPAGVSKDTWRHCALRSTSQPIWWKSREICA